MALDGLGEKLRSLFKSKDDPRFKGQGRRLGTAETHSSVPRPHQPQPAVDTCRPANRPPTAIDTNAPSEASSPLKPPPQPLGSGGRPALVLSRSHRTEDVVLDAAVMANTPTGREAHLVSAHKPPGGVRSPSHLGPGSPPPPHPAYSPPLQAPGSPCSTTAGGGPGTVVAGAGPGLTVEVPRASGGGGRGAAGGGHAVGPAGRGRGGISHQQSRTSVGHGHLSTMVSTISTPTAAEKRMGGFRCPAPPTDGAMADYGLAPATSQAYELQRCLALVLSSRPLSASNLSTDSSLPATATAVAAAAAAALPPPVSGAASAAAAEPLSPSSATAAHRSLDPLASSSTLSRSLAETSTSTAAVAAAAGGDPATGAAGPRECCEALMRLLRNVLTRPDEPKFRQIRLSNSRVQETIVGVPGAVEFLEAAGFQMRFSPDDGSDTANQGYLALPDEVHPTALAEAFRILSAVMAAHGFASPAPTPAVDAATTATAPAGQQPRTRQSQPPPQQQSGAPTTTAAAAAAAAVPAVERCTQVFLPAAADVTVPDWFFERTGAEIREQWSAMLRRREEAERFMTRTMREVRRQQEAAEAAAAAAGPGGGGAPGNVATVRVRFPEGVCLQGQFGAAEPVSRVFEWVAASLRSPALTFELIKPDRRPLETTTSSTTSTGTAARSGGAGAGAAKDAAAGAGRLLTVRGADMLPSILLNLRPTGQEAAALAAANVPLLSDELLRTTKPQ